MWLSNHLAQHLRWSIRLYRKLFYREGGYTLAVVISTLTSQIATLFAFFLPLKVIILIGSPTVPDYFPGFLAQFERSQQVMWLGGGAIVSFLIHQLADYIGKYCAEQGAERVLSRTQKLPLFSGQDALARKAYQRLASNVAAYVFLLLTLLLYLLIYPRFFAVVVGFLMAAYGLLLFATQLSNGLRSYLTTQTATLITLLGGVGFFIAFSFMAYDYLSTGSIGMVAAVISLLMSRQFFQRLTALVKESIVLEQQRSQINALFLHNHHFEQPSQQKSFVKALLNPATQHQEIQQIVTLLLNEQPLEGQNPALPSLKSIQWQQTGLPDVLAFHVVLTQSHPYKLWSLRLHIFHSRHHTLAVHENDLLLQSEHLPTLRLHSIAHYGDYHVHAFQVETLRRVTPAQLKHHHAWLHARNWHQTPSEELVDRYQRTHPQLPERLQRLLPGALEGAANSAEQHAQLDHFMQQWPAIHRMLTQLPLVIINKDATNADLVFSISEDPQPESYRIALWGRWVLEPIGSYYAVDEASLSQLPSLLSAAARQHHALQGLDPQKIEAAAWLHIFEARLQKQKFRSALELLPTILACMESINAKANNAA